MEVALISSEIPSDYYLDYTRGETLKTLEPYWKKGLAEGKSIDFKSDAAARFFLGKIGTEDLLKMKRTRGVCLEILFRKGVREEDRRRALADLAKLANVSQPKAHHRRPPGPRQRRGRSGLDAVAAPGGRG